MDTSDLTRKIPKPPYPIEWFGPQALPTPPMVMGMYRNMRDNERFNFHKDNPDYFKQGGEGHDYLDICDRIKNENSRNLKYLQEELDGITNAIIDKKQVSDMIALYKSTNAPTN